MATFHHSETACPHFSSSLLQSDKIDQLFFYLYYQNMNRSLAKQDDAIITEMYVKLCPDFGYNNYLIHSESTYYVLKNPHFC